jgi:hypothetical protein
MIQSTTLGAIIKRNTDTASVQPNVFLAAASGHRKNRLPSGPVDTHGRRGTPFVVR